MTTALDRIVDYKKDEVARLKLERSSQSFLADIKTLSKPRGFEKRLNDVAATGSNALICEVKRKSPSAGLILADAHPKDIARQYERAGAACLSILTDFPSFGGNLEDFQEVRESVEIPMLRKDFMIDPIQILESRASGADCILVIMASLDDKVAKDLFDLATELGMDTLVEVHDAIELDRAMAFSPTLVGVNNRNLKTMTTDLATSELLAGKSTPHSLVSESGVKTPDDICRLRQFGYRRFLIGESLMKQTDREHAVKSLVNARVD
ncbi:MAG: indole-3-glycerol phosphate synthase [Ponticaulis sp.]|nr:indole-3-glycerol phosphate synthase [Ponticaulis sp.]